MAETHEDEKQPREHDVMRLFERPIQIRSFIMTAILVILLLYTLYFARFIFIPVALALIFNLLLGPVVTRMQRFYIPRWISALLLIGSFAAIVAYGCYMLMARRNTGSSTRPRRSPPSRKRRPSCSSRSRT